ncbi:tetratricopeptide repeat protein [Nannocystaceae bacterium ST9]
MRDQRHPNAERSAVDSLAVPIERVVEGAEWFIRTPSIRFLHVATSNLVRSPVLRHLTATELLDQNTSPFFVLEAPTEPTDDGWLARIEELRIDWQTLLDDAPASSGLPPLWPEELVTPPLVRFARECGQALARCPAQIMEGLVIVLAPVWISDGARFNADVEALVMSSQLARARFIVVEPDTTHTFALANALGTAGMVIDARVDQAALRRESRARVESIKTTIPGSTGAILTGAAGPSVLPPPRRSQPVLDPEFRDATAREFGFSPITFDIGAMNQLGAWVLSAAMAMRDGNPIDAIRQQRDVRDFCAAHDLRRETIVHEMILASYVLQSGESQQALELFASATKRAREAEFVDLAVQAWMAVGSCLVVLERTDQAALAFTEAAQFGAGTATPALVIEAYRVAGQLLVSLGRDDDAAVVFHRAIELAESDGPQTPRASATRDVMRELAALCRRHGLVRQADSLEGQALALDCPEPLEA